MSYRFGWGRNGGDTVGDVAAALGGRSFGEVLVAAVYSPTKAVIDAQLGDTFTLQPKAAAASIIRVGAPLNPADGSEITLRFTSSTTLNTVSFVTSASSATWKLASASFTLVASKTRLLQFKYIASLNAYVELSRTLIAGA